MTEARVRSYYELVDRGEVTELVQLFAQDALYLRPGYPPIRGRSELERFYREQRAIKCGHHAVESVVGVHPPGWRSPVSSPERCTAVRT
ncbi:nuclear transport factor 2 family protein [Micromonospora echinospora]|uniref:nuclear transport factor 2 family protein n=1 Tax=Micromonospora echinospora TaxID=1877 RepID=UPI003CEBDE6D